MEGSNQHSSGRVTMNDVARRAAVSLKSVSRVVNREPHISERLRTKVEAAIAELGFVPDPSARSLAGGRSFTIGIMLDNSSPHYMINAVEGAYRACRDNGYHLQIDNMRSRREGTTRAMELAHVLQNSRIEGFILTPPICDDAGVLDILEAKGIAYSRIAPVLDPGRSAAVCIDDARGAADLAELFLRAGHRHFGIVNGPEDHGAAVVRRKGFLDKVAQMAPDAIISEANGRFQFEGGIAAGTELLTARPRPTAIFAANDDSAAGVMSACAQLGLSVPRDVSICGFDDSWVAKSVWPYLTTVHQPVNAMAYAAAMCLIERTTVTDPPTTLMLDWELIERDTIAPPP